jgi:hypothetical protein
MTMIKSRYARTGLLDATDVSFATPLTNTQRQPLNAKVDYKRYRCGIFTPVAPRVHND